MSVWISFFVVFLAAVVVWIVRPLLRPSQPWRLQSEASLLDELSEEKDRVLRVIKDLEMEREAGTLVDEEYERLRESYRIEAALIQRRIHTLRDDTVGPQVLPRSEGPDDESPEGSLEDSTASPNASPQESKAE